MNHNYGGLPKEFSEFSRSKIVLLPVPFDKTTTYIHGADQGPAALIEASKNMELYDIETGIEVYRHGIHTAAPILASSSEEMIETLYQKVVEFLKDGKFVVTLGGEHAISFSPIRAHAEKYPGIGVLQLDAHADLYQAYEGNRWSHASVMARVRELDIVSKVVSAGIRSLAAEELPYLERDNTFFAHEIYHSDTWIDEVVALLPKQVYITFDLDAFDASLMPSTGTPEPGGLGWYQALKLLREVAEKKDIVGCDVVELCPQPNNKAPDFLVAKLVYKILSYCFQSRNPP